VSITTPSVGWYGIFILIFGIESIPWYLAFHGIPAVN